MKFDISIPFTNLTMSRAIWVMINFHRKSYSRLIYTRTFISTRYDFDLCWEKILS